MNWTKEPPIIDGWYWVHLDFGMTSVEYIYEDEYDPDTMLVGVDDVTCPLEEYLKYSPMFYGPIKPPELPR